MPQVAVDTQTRTPAEELLEPLLQGDFVLTDARGMVTRWGSTASWLFGWRSEDVIGRSAFDAVLASGGDEWRRHLEVGEGPRPAARVEASAKRDDGHRFPVELLFLPVRLSESLELSRLLEVVGGDENSDDKLTRLRRHNATALESMLTAAGGSLNGSDDSRLAGMVVTFRALGETPWVHEQPAAPVAAPPGPAPAAVGPGEEQLLRVGNLERAEEELRAALERETGEISSLEQTTAELRASLEHEAAELRAALAEEAQALRAALEQARDDVASARALAEQAFALAEEAHLEAERRHHVREDAGRAAAQPAEPEPPAREPRPGFDDSDQPLALIALDGRFEQINPAFEQLVGYSDREFRRARWPSLVDSENLMAHRALLVQLAAGEVERAGVDTMYLHAQGLLVPVKGGLELVRNGGGVPAHMLLSVDVES